MFPSKGTSVWVNFRDKPYLGKVLQTSPELDMVCVRISNYFDHVSRNVEDQDLFSHSCPESNTSLLQGSQSSMIITCGLDDIFPLNSTISQEFKRMHISHDDHNFDKVYVSENIQNSSVENYINDEYKSNPLESNITLSESMDNCDEDDNFSNSFGIKNILNKTYDRKIDDSKERKIWKCRYCNLFIVDENNMNHHILTEHQLESHLGPDNWIVIGGVRGFEYEEVKYKEDFNEKSLNNIYLSNTITRKRQFSEYTPFIENEEVDVTRESQFYDSLETSIRSETDTNFNAFKIDDNHIPILAKTIQKRRYLIDEIEEISTSSDLHISSFLKNELSDVNNEDIELQNRNEIFQQFLLNNNVPSSITFSVTNSLPNFTWSEKFRSNSFSNEYSRDPTFMNINTNNYQPMFASPKRTKVENTSKKCRKMYGIEQRHLWCNQCKWKKACSRFGYEINTSL